MKWKPSLRLSLDSTLAWYSLATWAGSEVAEDFCKSEAEAGLKKPLHVFRESECRTSQTEIGILGSCMLRTAFCNVLTFHLD